MKVMPDTTLITKNQRLAIFSDLHLGVHTNSSSWHQISLDWAKWYVQQLEENSIKDIVFCGDFFHNRSEITVNTLFFASEFLNLFNDFNLFLLAGNHDSFYKNNCSVNSIKIFEGRTPPWPNPSQSGTSSRSPPPAPGSPAFQRPTAGPTPPPPSTQPASPPPAG